MRWGARADENGCYQWILEHPGHRELQRRHAHSCGQAMQQSYAGKIAFIKINIGVPRDHIEAGAFGYSRTISGVFAGEKTRGERAVGHYAHLLTLHHGESIVSGLQEVVRQLDGFKALQAQPATGFEGGLQLWARMIAAASGACETSADDCINRGRGFFDRRDAVVTVIKIKIDAVGLEPAEAGLDRGTDVGAGEFPRDLGREGNLVATAAGLQPAPHDFFRRMHFIGYFPRVSYAEVVTAIGFRLAAAIGFGGIEQGDAVFAGIIHQGKSGGFRDFPAEGRAAERESTYAEWATPHDRRHGDGFGLPARPPAVDDEIMAGDVGGAVG